MEITRIRRAWLLHILIFGLGLAMLYPILWLIASSFKPSYLIFSDQRIWPAEFTIQNYIDGWKGILRNGFHTFMINSIVLCLFAVIGNVISCSLTAFAFGRLNFRFKTVLFALMLTTIMLPHHVTIIPQYVLFRELGWVDTYLPLIAPKWLATEAFFVFLMVQFIRGLPKDLDESARIDGCGPGQIYWRIIMPLMVPALITTALFSFVWTWDDFFSQLLYINSVQLYTVPLGLRLFLDSTADSAWGPLFAMSVVALIPSLILFFTMQKYFVEGISTTGLKG
ncbi:carbohydrate ABC transporter permease [Cohnella cellulosilytica]|uniref:Carbohydrate ABC transporter permease n=1 Tax=Cohnella cellulosilytica TaxID=986710 RepID=A0ABW2FEW4_9BACL